MHRVIMAVLTLALFVLAAPMAAAQGGQQPTGGTFIGSSAAPGGDNQCTVKVDQSGAGTLTVLAVVVTDAQGNRTTLTEGTGYTMNNTNGTSTPDVTFLPGHVPAAGETVTISGSTSSGSGEYPADVDF
jgi:hypothetical protein